MGWVMSWGAFIGVLKALLGTYVKSITDIAANMCDVK